MGRMGLRRAARWAGALIACLLFACEREYESPYLPGSGAYAGDDWTRDSDGDGVADSVEHYAPECSKQPKVCIENAKVLSRIGPAYSLAAVDMILWEGAVGADPRISWDPTEASLRSHYLSSSDTAVVKVRDGLLDAKAPGMSQISVTVHGETRAASFLVRVVPKEGKRVSSCSAKDMVLEAGQEGAPEIAWTPEDAAHKDYVLSVELPSVAWPVGGNLKAIWYGTTKVTIQALDGGHKTTFNLKVTESTQRVEAVSVASEDMYLVAGGPAEAPVIQWNPHNVTSKRYLLAPADTSIAGVSKDRESMVALKRGKTQVNLYTLDGGGKATWFTVHVVDTAVAVSGLAAEDMKLPVGGAPAAPRLAWTPTDATNRKFSLVSDNPMVASVEGGFIRPEGIGRAGLTALSADGGHKAEFLVDVIPQDTGIHVDSIKAGDMTLTAGFSREPQLTWYPEDAGNQDYTLTTGDSTVAAINGSQVRGVKSGTVTVTVITADGGKIASFKVNVASAIIPVQSVQGSPMSLVVGQIESPSLSWQPGTATNLDYTLASDNSGIARIVDGTSVEGMAVGTANITIRSADGPADTIRVTVNAKSISPTAVQVANFNLEAGEADRDVSGQVQWTPANATVKTFKLISSSNAAALTIADNKLRGIASGVSNVILEAQDGIKARDTFTVTVKQPVKGIVVKDTAVWPGSADIDPSTLITWTPSNADIKTFTLASLDTLVATVIAGTKLRPKYAGSANVILRSVEYPSKLDTFKVTVMVPVQSLKIRDTTVYVGWKHINPYPSVTWTPANATDKNWFLIWASPKTNTVVDSVSWWFNAVGPGFVDLIYVSSQNNAVRDTFRVTVVQPVGSLTAAPMTIKVGDADQAPFITWNPANASNTGYTLSGGSAGIATAVNGKVHAEGPGQATFTIRSNDGGKTVIFVVTVAQPVTGVSTVSFDMKVGDSDATPNVTLQPANATDKSWTLTGGAAGIATVVANKVHAVGPGTAAFTVRTNDGGRTAQLNVNVSQGVTSISAAAVTMNRGEADRDPVITWNPANASNKNYTLSGGNGIVASVVGNKIRALGGGTVGFIVTTQDGARTASFSVSVNVPVIAVQGQAISMRLGDPDEVPQLNWTPTDATNKGYTLISSNPSNVQIIEGIRIRAISSGDAIVTVTSNDGQRRDTFAVEVRGGFGN